MGHGAWNQIKFSKNKNETGHPDKQSLAGRQARREFEITKN
jgi:hypothetical protein